MKSFKVFLLTALTSALCLSLVGCGEKAPEPPPAEPTPPPAADESAAVTAYPLDICLVSDEELGSMGDPIVMVHAGQQVKFCCDECKPAFEKDPAKYLAKLK